MPLPSPDSHDAYAPCVPPCHHGYGTPVDTHETSESPADVAPPAPETRMLETQDA